MKASKVQAPMYNVPSAEVGGIELAFWAVAGSSLPSQQPYPVSCNDVASLGSHHCLPAQEFQSQCLVTILCNTSVSGHTKVRRKSGKQKSSSPQESE